MSGLTSRCMMPWPCIYLRAQPSSEIQNLTASSVKVFLEMWKRRSPPLMRSTTRYLAEGQYHGRPRESTAGLQGRDKASVHVFYILEAVSQVADKRVVDMLEHATLADNISYTLGTNDCTRTDISTVARPNSGGSNLEWGAPSSLRMYLSANERPVSLRSTIRTLPKAPRPTTRSRRKWFKLTRAPPALHVSLATQFAASTSASQAGGRGVGCVAVYLRRRTRRVCPGCYPLERAARPSISKHIRSGIARG